MKENSTRSGLGFGARVLTLAFLLVVFGSPHASAQQGATPLGADEASAIATDAYIYGYPLVTMEYTRRVLTNVAEASRIERADGTIRASANLPDALFAMSPPPTPILSTRKRGST